MDQLKRLNMVLTAYGMPHTMGYLPTQAGEPHPDPVSPIRLLEIARQQNLTGIEIPLTTRVPSFDGKYVEISASLDTLKAALEESKMQVVADYGAILDQDADHLKEYLHKAQAMGATLVRATLSALLCGDRRSLVNGWEAHLEAVAARLREVLPCAEELGLSLAMENHQDATTDDLIRLYEMSGSSPAYGITLDTGNPLAVGEEPVEAAQRMAPLIRHLHLKDYTIHFAPEGYRLVRCAAGEGVVDFPAILEAVLSNGHNVLPGIEIAAQATRTIPLLEPTWWDCYPPVLAKSLTGALRILWEKGRPMHEPYSSAWERGENSLAVSEEEADVVRRSIAYFQNWAEGRDTH